MFPETLPRICLNMIVKNESAILSRCFHAVAPYIDEYCIVDTGSTDGTPDFIQSFFKNCPNPIPGEVYEEPFQDFGYNRSHALQQASKYHSSCDFILLIDADMVFQSNLSGAEFRTMLLRNTVKNPANNAYYIFQGTDAHYYKNVRIVRNPTSMVELVDSIHSVQTPPTLAYWGVTHEYIQIPSSWNIQLLDKKDVFILDVGDGGAKADKFQRDIRLLKKGLETHPNNDRYTFYLANSYRDAGDYDAAIQTFQTRIHLGGWMEEIWQSYYNIGRCYQYKGNMPAAIYWWLEGYAAYPHRIENLYEVVHYYRLQPDRAALAYLYTHVAAQICLQGSHDDHLFLQKDVYDYKLWSELSIIGYYHNPHKYNLPNVCMKVLNCAQTPDSIRANVWSNYKFYAPALCKPGSSFSFVDTNAIPVLQKIGETIPEVWSRVQSGDLVRSTPSICKNPNLVNQRNWMVCQRFVNYRIDGNGHYINKDYVETVNVWAELNSDRTIVLKEWVMPYTVPDDGKYKGIEDVRLSWNTGDSIVWTGVRGQGDKMVVACGKYDGEHTDIVTHSSKQVEKNWVYLHNKKAPYDQAGRLVYQWYPKQIGVLSADNQFTVLNEEIMPPFFRNARGSTHGIVVCTTSLSDDVQEEIWILVHFVSYESRRFYYHAWVVLDRSTGKLKTHSVPFTFEGAPVEYALGLEHDSINNTIFVSYSVNDCVSRCICMPVSSVRDFIYKTHNVI